MSAKGGCIWAKLFYLGKMVLFGEYGSIWANFWYNLGKKWLYLFKIVFIWANKFYLGKRWLYLGKLWLYLGFGIPVFFKSAFPSLVLNSQNRKSSVYFEDSPVSWKTVYSF